MPSDRPEKSAPPPRGFGETADEAAGRAPQARAVNINEFMGRFHAIERQLNLFESAVDGELWWDSVRFDACYFLFDCLTGLTYSSAHVPWTRPRRLGTLRRWGKRQLLFARGLVVPKDLMVIRAARNMVDGRLHDVALDPVSALFPGRVRAVDTVPQRYHLPDFDPSRWPGKVPQTLAEIARVFVNEFGLEANRAAQLEALIRRGRGDYAAQVDGYHRLFARMRPKAVLLVQNGIEKALFHVAKTRGVPAIEAQHGLIGYGHPAYSYPQGVDYSRQTGMPDLFLTFSEFWQTSGYYPAGRHAVIGTDHFAAGFAPIARPLGAVMVIAANIYHRELLDLTCQVAAQLPDRKFIYKLHPNQSRDVAGIRAAVAALPNIEIGDPLTPASRLMGDVSHLVAIQSTVVYEALQHGRRVCIVPRHDYHIHADIFDLAQVSVPGSVAALAAALEVPSDTAEGPVFFEKFDPQRAFELLAPLLDRGA